MISWSGIPNDHALLAGIFVLSLNPFAIERMTESRGAPHAYRRDRDGRVEAKGARADAQDLRPPRRSAGPHVRGVDRRPQADRQDDPAGAIARLRALRHGKP